MSSTRIALCGPTSTSHAFQWEMRGLQTRAYFQSALPRLVFSSFSPLIVSFKANHNPHVTTHGDSHCIFEFLVPFLMQSYPKEHWIEDSKKIGPEIQEKALGFS